MKKVKYLTSLFAAGLFFVTAHAQDLSHNQVPSIVINAFKSQFPKATDIDWERSRGHYEVEFEVDRLDHEVWLDQEGKIIRHQQELRVRALPGEIKTNIRNQYKGYRILEADKLQVGGVTAYKLELISFTKKTEIIVDARGQLLEGFIWN